MKSMMIGFVAAGVLAASGAQAQQVTELLGKWQGEVSTYGYPVYVDFLTANNSTDSFTGTLDVTCGSSNCGTSGVVDFSGTLVGTSVTFTEAGSKTRDGFATISANDQTLSGCIIDNKGADVDFSVTRVPEIDPASAASALTLLIVGLAVFYGRRRSYTEAPGAALG